MTMRRYSNFKSSGVPWFGDVPAHWDVVRLKFVAHVQTGVAKGKDNTGKNSVEVPYLRVANVQDGYLDLDDVATIEIPQDDLERYRLQAGDVLMNEGGDFDKLGRGHVWDGSIDPCIHQNHVFAVRPFGLSPEWLNLFTGSVEAQFYFMSRSKQSTNLASISSTNLMELPVVVPPPKERAAISLFLRTETNKIDALVEEQQRMIDLLKEKHQAVISQAVTKGLNPSVPMKDSAVEWLGMVPAHWDVQPCRAIVLEKSLRNEGAACQDYLSLMANVGVIPYAEKGDVGNKAPEDLSKCKLVSAGDIVINSMNYGIGSFGLSALDGVCSPVYVVLRPINTVVETRFAFGLFANRAFQTYAQSFGNGILAHRAAIGWDTLKAIGVPVPPLEEQRTILAHIDAETGRFETLITEASVGVTLLQERRAALISAAVTGKIDVRGLAFQPEGAAA